MMRLFLAVDLDAAARERAAGVARRLRHRFDLQQLPVDLNWTTPEKLHVTLRFLGQVEDRTGSRLRNALETPLDTAPFDAILGAAGAFPRSGPPRVLWLGVTEGVAGLRSLYDEVASRLATVGFPPESRPFAAHLTLARLRRPCSGPANTALRQILREVTVTATWRVDRVTLYESRLSPQGATYVPLQYVSLTDHERISNRP